MVNDSDLSDPTGTLQALGTELSFDTGFNINGAFGYEYDSGLRVEGELAYRANDFDEVIIGAFGLSAPIEGDIEVFSIMLNGFYDIPLGGSWIPYIGGGIGVGFVRSDLSTFGIETDPVFAYQVGAGIGYEITPSIIVALDYRFFATTDPEFNTGIEAEYSSHNVGLNLRFRL